MYQDTLLLRKENNVYEVSLDGEEWIKVDIALSGLKDDEYLIEFYIDILSYSPYKPAPAPKNDWLMATPPEPEEVDYEIVGAIIIDSDMNEIAKMSLTYACKVIGVFDDIIYECVLEYARERYNGSLYN